MELGFLKVGDLFEFDGKTYECGHADGRGYVYCTNIKTYKVTRLYIGIDVKKVERDEK